MKLIPYLYFDGNAEEALKFYEEVFDGEITHMSRYGDAPMPADEDQKNKVMNASFVFDGNLFMVSDTMKNQAKNSGGNVQISLDVDEEKRLDVVFEKMSEGGNISMPLSVQFWGAKFGMITDKFGIDWMFNCDIKK